jgi:hypothetical protein
MSAVMANAVGHPDVFPADPRGTDQR